MEGPINHLPAISPPCLECTTDTSGLIFIPTISTDSLLLVPKLSALPVMVLLILLLLPPLFLPVFPTTPTVLLLPPLPPIPLARAPVGLGRAPIKSALSPPVISIDGASITEFLLPLPRECCLSRSFVRVYEHFFDLICPLTRHPFKLLCLARPLFHIFLRRHMKRCVRVAPIHFLVEMPHY